MIRVVRDSDAIVGLMNAKMSMSVRLKIGPVVEAKRVRILLEAMPVIVRSFHNLVITSLLFYI